MSTKGKRKYTCEDCGESRLVHWTELNRAGKPRCFKCGSTRLAPGSDEAHKDVLAGNLNRHTGAKPSVVFSNTIKMKDR
jgi:DNA-directed RNA polymerase subunit RPC12/RpoP